MREGEGGREGGRERERERKKNGKRKKDTIRKQKEKRENFFL